ncbi:MAG: CDP-glycerol glycerophosphotransferase family protein [Candidatus Faecisoma sp.]|nr:CDP-glycerol glycerophosphotransferase family protein [Acholeplasma sp.]MDY2893166.1 CDP-glycerol glycerophosphotransferase family protein [Candidatus Faecisoma sp.]
MKTELKKRIKKYCSNNKIIQKPYNYLLKEKRKINYRMKYLNNPIDDKLIVFEAFMGRKYVCSPKAIYEFMLKDDRFSEYTFVWAFKNPKSKKKYFNDSRTKLVTYNRAKYFEYCSKAKYWITNSRIPETLIKKDEQIYVQCWHGTPLKRLGHDIEIKKANSTENKKIRNKRYDKDASMYNYMISPSRFCTEKFTSAFNLKELNKEDVIIEKGYPRNDYLFNYKKGDVRRIKKELNIPSNKKVILYAPTFRDNQHSANIGYTYNVELDFDKLKKEISDEYIVLFRPHYFIANKFDFKKYNGFVYNVSEYEDINELYIISDILITDYSSVFFDFANLKKPMIFYMYDKEEYKNNLRDFYIDLKELPGPIIETQRKLISEIKNIDEYSKKYGKKYEKFNKKYNYLDDGKATERVIEVIFGDENKKEN